MSLSSAAVERVTRSRAGRRLRERTQAEGWFAWPSDPPEGPPVGEVAVVAGLAAFHVVNHYLIPERRHVLTHLAAAGAAVSAAVALGADVDDLGLAPDRLADGVRRGLIAAGVNTLVIGGAALVPATRDVFADERVLGTDRRAVITRAAVNIPLGTALYEELVFRSVLLGLAMRRLPPFHAAVGTSVLFGLWHVIPALKDRHGHQLTEHRHPLEAVAGAIGATTVGGLLFARLRLTTGSAVAPFLAHLSSNVVGYLTATAVARRDRDVVSRTPAPSTPTPPPREVDRSGR